MGNHQDILALKGRAIFSQLVPLNNADPVNISARRGTNELNNDLSKPPLQSEINILGTSKDNVRCTIMTIENMHFFGDMFVNYLKARHNVFIKKKGWELPEVDDMEFDQYDTPKTRWVIIHAFGEILAGVRLAPTTAICGCHSYMIRDAQLGLLTGMPTGLLYNEAPVADHVWEATRLFVSEEVPADRRLEIQKHLIDGMASCARSVGATHVIGIVPAIFKRWLKWIGLTATAIGPVMRIEGDMVQSALLNTIGYNDR